MIANHLFGACLPTFGNCADRYCLSGYGGGGAIIGVERSLDETFSRLGNMRYISLSGSTNKLTEMDILLGITFHF